MGVYDRDYYRRDGPSFLGSITETGKMCKTLIIINVVVFFCQLLTGDTFVKTGPFTEFLWLSPDDVSHGFVWQLLTHAFLHSMDIWHIAINMLVLWWFGSQIEDLYGPKEFLALYLTAAVGSGVMYVLWGLLVGPPYHPAIGTSGAVAAVFVLFACHYPRRIIYVFFVIPCPVWLLAVIYVGSDFLAMINVGLGGDNVAHAGHVGGALLGFLYYHSGVRLLNFVPDIKAWNKRRQQPRLRVYRGDPEPEPEPPTPVSVTSAPPAPRRDLDEHLEAKLDAVLEKVARVGKDNLTDGEREILQRASELYRRRRT